MSYSTNRRTKRKESVSDLSQQVVVSAVILFLIGILEIGIEIFAIPLTTDELLVTEWNTFSYGTPSVTLTVPKELRQSPPLFPKDLWRYLQNIEGYSFKESNLYTLSVNHMTYIFFLKPDAADIAQATIDVLKTQKGITGVKFKEVPYTLGALKGVMQYGTFEKEDGIIEFTTVYLVRSTHVWIITAKYANGDPFARKITAKILKSIIIENS